MCLVRYPVTVLNIGVKQRGDRVGRTSHSHCGSGCYWWIFLFLAIQEAMHFVGKLRATPALALTVLVCFSEPLLILWISQDVLVGDQCCICSWTIFMIAATLPGFQVCEQPCLLWAESERDKFWSGHLPDTACIWSSGNPSPCWLYLHVAVVWEEEKPGCSPAAERSGVSCHHCDP